MTTDASPAAEPVRQYRFTLPPGACDMLLVRHGESAPVVAGEEIPLRDGHADPALAPEGQEEAHRVADRLASEEISAIYVTRLRRTHQTAAPLAARVGLTPVEDPDLHEVHLGEWEGIYRVRIREDADVVERLFTEQRWDVIPGAEATEAFAARVRRGLERIAAAHPDQRVVVVVHGGVVGMALHLATRSDPFAFLGADNASISHLVVTQDRWILRRFNDTGHLGTDLDKPVQPLT